MAKTLSVVTPVFNCAENLRKCLESVKWANEIIVIDMGSSDDTLDVARSFNTKIYINIPKNGNFDINRKFGMLKANGDWILKLDSDEILSNKLQIEIQNLLRNEESRYNGYRLRNQIFMFGYQIKHGFVKPYSSEMRLVRKGKWQYNPYKFHQQITVSGEIGILSGYYDHYNYGSVSEFFSKMNKYTSLDALTNINRTKIRPATVLVSPFKSFFKLFIIQKGFLDRRTGLIVCILFSLYNLVEKVKIWENQNI